MKLKKVVKKYKRQLQSGYIIGLVYKNVDKKYKRKVLVFKSEGLDGSETVAIQLPEEYTFALWTKDKKADRVKVAKWFSFDSDALTWLEEAEQ